MINHLLTIQYLQNNAAFLPCYQYFMKHMIFYLFLATHNYFLQAKLFASLTTRKMAWTVAYVRRTQLLYY